MIPKFRTVFALPFSLFFLAAAVPVALAQTDAPLVETAETHYFDFWPGTWAQVVDGRVDTTATVFTVRQSVHPAAYQEDWRQVYDGGAHYSTALRAWDQVTNKWLFTWVSDNGLHQVWDGQKIGGHWYIVKEFDINGTHLISRQAWIQTGPNELDRLMERSFDNGNTWEVRSRRTFRRISEARLP